MTRIKEAAILQDGIIYTGKRHSDIVRKMLADKIRPKHGGQGFITDEGKFVDRREAGRIAFESKQIEKPTDLLTSENLY